VDAQARADVVDDLVDHPREDTFAIRHAHPLPQGTSKCIPDFLWGRCIARVLGLLIRRLPVYST
jgi:hypothetical protein